MDRIEFIEAEIEDLRKVLTNHRLYEVLSDMNDIRTFMESHVYAVWDFMSLLKALQHNLTCTTLPWKPVKNAATARFINEIVFGEETDVNENQVPRSHFEMYLDAMQEVSASTTKVLRLVDDIDSLEQVDAVLAKADLRPAERKFLQFTFDTIKTNDTHKIAAAFTFGREDLIPDMFIEIIKGTNNGTSKNFPKLLYYLERHIEVDGDEHGPLSLAMIRELCGDDDKKWSEALDISKAALQHRINLWDEIATTIQEQLVEAN
jgi:hypothetical protein